MTTPADTPADLQDSLEDDAVPTDGSPSWRELLFQSNPAPMWIFDRETLRFLAVNDATTRHYGWSRDELLGMSILDIRPREDVPLVLERAAAETRSVLPPETWRHQRRDGSVVWARVTSSKIHYRDRPAWLVVAMDVSDAVSAREALARSRSRLLQVERDARDAAARQAEEARLRQVSRAESVARLAAGIAHDFNNLLTAIRCSADLLAESMPDADDRRLDVADITRAADRAGVLTRQLLGFARQQVVEPRVLDLNVVVTELESMLEATLTEDVELVVSLDPALGRVRADRDQLQQVVHALAMNARDAMPDGGVLLVQTGNVELDEGALPEAPDSIRFTPGPYVLLGVSDTGTGMDAETQARIFEPFFTTKAPGKGSGLGLASVYGIVKQAGGFIFVRSRPGAGTRFTIYLPRVEAAPDPAPAVTAPANVDARGEETVLVVEDEPMILDLACRVLRAHGYTVLGATGGDEALALAAAHDGVIDLLVSDVVMPRMGGPALAERLVAMRGTTRVLYISGYTEGAIVRQRVLQRGVQLLEKPFTPRQLLERVRLVLDA